MRRQKTPGRSVPGTGGTKGVAPVAMTRQSYFSVPAEPSALRTLTSCAAASSAVASTPVSTSTPVSPSYAWGVLTMSPSREGMSPLT